MFMSAWDYKLRNMRRGILVYISLVVLAALDAAAQNTPPAGSNWKPPRTPDGQPDIQGIWTNATLTPLQRPADLGDKQFFTEQEAAAYEKQRIQQTDVDRVDGERGPADLARRAYNNFWFERGTRVVESRRTSLIVDPPDGKIPPLTPAAQKRSDNFRAQQAQHPSDGPEDRLLTERCILFGAAGPPMLPEPYNSNYRVVQGPGYVAILVEMNHETRIIPLDGRPHLSANVSQWTGDSRGHWDGDTLVVETTNFKFNDQSRFGVGYLTGMSDENLRVVERFTRTNPDTIIYRATITDPTVFTRPWTVEISMMRYPSPVLEYACNEGNYGMFGILSGARAEEKSANR
jgi:hypothetical protein